MSKFEEMFSEPVDFSNGEMLLSGINFSKQEAAEMFSEYFGEEVKQSSIGMDRVRFGFPPEHVEEREMLDSPCWYSGAGNGKGTKPVWTCPCIV